ncbi:MAG: patatin-like phospholipase family protein [Sphingobium sp.]|nr:patatin-like phospholipase family protein [Sphingobium sp.]
MDDLRNPRFGKKALRHNRAPLPLPDHVVLVLQGGGALGSYQAGVYQELSALDIDVDWVAGISIGAINAAIIAGNPPEQRIEKMRSFWNKVSGGMPNFWLPDNHHIREAAHVAAAAAVTLFGVPGFFRPHYSLAPFLPANGPETMGLYDTTPLAETLNELIDWDLLNDGPVRLSVGAVDIESGNFTYFDTQGFDSAKCKKTRIDARHIMASGALPPGLPPVEIDGRYYWDGGLVSNTPLSHVLDQQCNDDMLVFQVDLFPAEGPMPKELSDIWSRQKDIQFSSRTRQVTDLYLRARKEHNAIRMVLDKLPPEMADDPDVVHLRGMVSEGALNIVHLIYRSREWESGARDFEFSRATMDDHWAQGMEAVQGVMHKGDLIARNIEDGSTATFDLDPVHQLKEKKI